MNKTAIDKFRDAIGGADAGPMDVLGEDVVRDATSPAALLSDGADGAVRAELAG